MTGRTIGSFVNNKEHFQSYLHVFVQFRHYDFQGQFNYVNIVIIPLDHGSNAVTVQTRDGTLLNYLLQLGIMGS